MRVLHEVEEHLLELMLVGPQRWATGELGHDLHVVLLELIRLQVEDAPHLIFEEAGMTLGRVVPREEEQVLDDARGARRLVPDDVQTLAHVVRERLLGEQEVRLPEDRRERIVDLVRDTGGELSHRRKLLGVDELCLRAPQVLELPARLRVEPRVVQRNADLVRRCLHERDLPLGERLLRAPSQRQRAQDTAAAVDRDADEAADVVGGHGDARLGQQGGIVGRILQDQRDAGLGHAAELTLADREEDVDVTEHRGEQALALEVELLAVLREEMEARHLVPGDVRQGVERRPEHLVDVQAAADSLRNGVEDTEMRLHDGGPLNGCGHRGSHSSKVAGAIVRDRVACCPTSTRRATYEIVDEG